MVNRNATNIYRKEYDGVRIKYGGILKEYVIQNYNDVTINGVWNVSSTQKVPDTDLKKAKRKK